MSAIPDISVIIPTYRRPTMAVAAAESALSQRDVSVEVHVIDDSPEGSAAGAVGRIADSRLTYRRRGIPSGGRPALVRNDGGATARGRYLHFLDDDDQAEVGAYAALTKALDADRSRGVAFGLVTPFGDDAEAVARERSFFESGAARVRRADRLRSRRWMATNLLFRATPLVSSACILRRECFAPLGGYDEEMSVIEDVDFYLRAIRRFGVVFVDRPVVRYRVGHGSLMHSPRGDHDVAGSWQRMFDKYRQHNGELETRALHLLSRTILRWL
jgi:glycosyltransferase involved in cell wall biosynthesis